MQHEHATRNGQPRRYIRPHPHRDLMRSTYRVRLSTARVTQHTQPVSMRMASDTMPHPCLTPAPTRGRACGCCVALYQLCPCLENASVLHDLVEERREEQGG